MKKFFSPKKIWILAILGILSIFWVMKSKTPILKAFLVPGNLKLSEETSQKLPINSSQITSVAGPKSNDSGARLYNKQEHIFKGKLPESFPQPRGKGEVRYKFGGTQAQPTMTNPEGQTFMLMPASALDIPSSQDNKNSKDPKTSFFSTDLFLNWSSRLFMSLNAYAESPPVEAVMLKDLVTLGPKGEFRNQGLRSLCTTFAFVAAMESVYKRDYGLLLDLSEQFAFHLVWTTNLKVNGVPSFFGGNSNFGQVSDALLKYGIPLESYSPYWGAYEDGGFAKMQAHINKYIKIGAFNWELWAPGRLPEHQELLDAMEYSEDYISQEARDHAVYRATDYLSIAPADLTIEFVEKNLKERQPVMITMAMGVKKVDGIHQVDEAIKGGAAHSMLMVGYLNNGDRLKSYFVIKDSRAPTDYFLLSYDAFDRLKAWGGLVRSVSPPTDPVPTINKWLGQWRMSNDGWQGRLVIRQASSDGQIGTFFAEGDVAGKMVVGAFSEAGQTLTYNIAPKVVDGNYILDGQPYILHQFFEDTTLLAGHTVWNKQQYGLLASRKSLEKIFSGTPPYTNAGKAAPTHWIGDWQLNLNGMIGVLKLSSATAKGQVNGLFICPGAVPETVIGQQVADNTHLIDLKIGTRPKIRLMRFTREHGRATGITTEGQSIGAHAIWNELKI